MIKLVERVGKDRVIVFKETYYSGPNCVYNTVRNKCPPPIFFAIFAPKNFLRTPFPYCIIFNISNFIVCNLCNKVPKKHTFQAFFLIF